MPITQDRVLALLEAAAAFRTARADLIAAIAYAQTSVARGTLDAREALTYIATAASVPEPPHHTETFLTERAHFHFNAGRNRANARRMAESRRRQGIAPARTTLQQSYDAWNAGTPAAAALSLLGGPPAQEALRARARPTESEVLVEPDPGIAAPPSPDEGLL